MKKEKFYIGLIVILLNAILTGCGSADNHISLNEESQESTSMITETSGNIFVYVTGAVKNPGVYCVETDSRIYQIINQAGGMTKNAKKDCLNLADKVYDGQKIHVMTKKEYRQQNSQSLEENSSGNSGGNESGENKVNINSATSEELTALPGIGTVKAEAIVAYRDENGNFSSIEDIKNVSGIGDATFANIESMITVN